MCFVVFTLFFFFLSFLNTFPVNLALVVQKSEICSKCLLKIEQTDRSLILAILTEEKERSSVSNDLQLLQLT